MNRQSLRREPQDLVPLSPAEKVNAPRRVSGIAWFLSAAAVLPCVVAAQPAAADLDELYARAKSAVELPVDSHWAFTVTSLADGTLRVARFDPRRPAPERWTLLFVDGKPATAGEVAEFREEADADDVFAAETTDVEGMVQPGSLQLVGETAEHWLLSFVPDEDNEDFAGNITGRISIAKDGPWLESIEVRNDKVVDAGLGTRITEFLMRYRFAPAVAGGPVVPRAAEERVKGQALLFIDFDEVEVDRYSDFEYAAGGAPP
ncbi:MAG: hypothetical protein R3315_05935 [Woeseiaceae bacterium]|nr:hypothetical protein [Woeseiaceae bacterium]